MERRLSETEAKCLFNAIQFGWRASASVSGEESEYMDGEEFCKVVRDRLAAMEKLQGFPYIEHLCHLVSCYDASRDTEMNGLANVKQAAQLLALMVTTFDTRLISELKCIERLAITACDYGDEVGEEELLPQLA